MNKLWCASVHIWLIGFTILCPLKSTCRQSVLYTLTMASQTHSSIVFSFSISCGGSNDTRVLICLSAILWQQTLWQYYTSHWIIIILMMLFFGFRQLPWLPRIPQSWWIYSEWNFWSYFALDNGWCPSRFLHKSSEFQSIYQVLKD